MRPADLRQLDLGLFSRSAQPTGTPWQQTIHPAGSELFNEIYIGMRDMETRQRQEAIADWASYLDETVARRLAAARLLWDERLRDLAIKLGEESDQVLTIYAAEVRGEFFPTVSSLEMQITLCNDATEQENLEIKLKGVLASIELKIAQRREELSQNCALELENMRRQANEDLANLTTSLKEEAQTELAAFKAGQDAAYADWLIQHNAMAQSSRRAGD